MSPGTKATLCVAAFVGLLVGMAVAPRPFVVGALVLMLVVALVSMWFFVREAFRLQDRSK